MIFLSYASQDRDRARSVAAALNSEEVPVWWDRDLSAGQRFEQVIRDKLSRANCVVVLWSRHSVESDWVKDEANEGKRRNVLVPALIDNVPIPYGFGQIHTANLTRWNGSRDDPEFVAFRAAITQLLGVNTKLPQPTTDSGSSIWKPALGTGETVRPVKEPQPRYHPTKWLLILACSLVVIGIAALWATRSERPGVRGMPFTEPLSFNTGWIYSGVYNPSGGIYVEGPYTTVAYRPGARERGAIVPRIGDVLKVVKERRVIIANFKLEGLKHQMISPPLINPLLTDADETGVILKKSTLILVRDTEISGDPGRSHTIWCRIVVCDTDTDGCVKASGELVQ